MSFRPRMILEELRRQMVSQSLHNRGRALIQNKNTELGWRQTGK